MDVQYQLKLEGEKTLPATGREKNIFQLSDYNELIAIQTGMPQMKINFITKLVLS